MGQIFKFPKSERLVGKYRLEQLFTEGEAFISYPLRVVYFFAEKDNSSVKTLVNVPKKRFKRAVKRNLLKRRMREAYRLNKESLRTVLEEKNRTLFVGFMYISNDILEYAVIEKKMKEALKKLAEISSEK